MEKIMKEFTNINTIFENNNIYKSIVVCYRPNYIYHLQNLLKQQLYPVELLRDDNFFQVLDKFQKGNLRMLIMSPVIFQVLFKRFTVYLKEVNVVLLSGGCETVISNKNDLLDGKKIFSLSN